MEGLGSSCCPKYPPSPRIIEYRGLLHFFYLNNVGFIRYRTYDGNVLSAEKGIACTQDLATAQDGLRGINHVQPFVVGGEICLCYQG